VTATTLSLRKRWNNAEGLRNFVIAAAAILAEQFDLLA
jgi:hypothetical protein